MGLGNLRLYRELSREKRKQSFRFDVPVFYKSIIRLIMLKTSEKRITYVINQRSICIRPQSGGFRLRFGLADGYHTACLNTVFARIDIGASLLEGSDIAVLVNRKYVVVAGTPFWAIA